MAQFLSSELLNIVYESRIRGEVEEVITDVVLAVEYSHSLDEARTRTFEFEKIKRSAAKLSKTVDKLRTERAEAAEVNARLQLKARETREKFVLDIAQILSDSRNTANLRTQTKQLQRKVHMAEGLEDELREAKQRIKELERTSGRVSTTVPTDAQADMSTESTTMTATAVAVAAAPPKKKVTFLVHAEDKLLLLMFSFLETKDVIYAAQVCRFTFKRVDTLFGIDSPTARAEWAVEPPLVGRRTEDSAITSSVGAAAGAGGGGSGKGSVGAGGLTKAMAEALSKKLTAPELKTIIAMSEQQRKANITIDQLQAEGEDLRARLESVEKMRDFLVNKLKEAEVAIKSSMDEKEVLKRQANTDHEVIYFLDNRAHELERNVSELCRKNEHLEASLDLLRNANSHKERLLLVEVESLKDKYESTDAAFKSQKKILVKEVKTLRSQLEAIREERDLYLGQLQVMREALGVGVGPGLGGGPSGRGSGNGGQGMGSGNGTGASISGRKQELADRVAVHKEHQRSATDGGPASRGSSSSSVGGSGGYHYSKNPSIFN